MATHGARRLGPMNANLARIIAIELMAAAEGIDFRRPLRSSEPIEDAHNILRALAAQRDEDREFSTDIEAVAGRIEAGQLRACRAASPRRSQLRLIDTPPSTRSAVPVVKLDASEAR